MTSYAFLKNDNDAVLKESQNNFDRPIENGSSKISIFNSKGDNPLRKRLRIRTVISVNYHYITVLCPFNLLINSL